MQWPWVSRRAVEEARRAVEAVQKENALVYGFLAQRDATISALQKKVSVFLQASDGASAMAEIFADQDSDWQAEFLETTAQIFRGWEKATAADTQMIWIVEALGESGRWLIDGLAEFLRLHREKASA